MYSTNSNGIQENHFVATKFTYDANRKISIDETSVMMSGGSSGIWSTLFILDTGYDFSEKNKPLRCRYYFGPRSACNKYNIKNEMSKLYAPFYYNVIDNLPEGMSNDFRTYLTPSIEKFFKDILKLSE